MPISTKVNDLKINKLTKAQYDAAVQEGIIGENELSIITDIEAGQVIQVDKLPEATSENNGKIYQYTGETIPDVEANAVVTQTVGSGLSDLSVKVDKFIEAEQPSGAETISFVADVVPDTSVVEDATAGLDYTFDGQRVIDYFNSIWGYHSPNMDDYVWGITYAVYTGVGSGWVLSRNQDGSNEWSIALPDGLTINSTPNLGDYIAIRSTMGSTIWSKNGTTVNLANYGISYSGIPVTGDTISVAYTPFVAGITNGYFYQNQPKYSDPIATIEQTEGRVDSISFETTVGNAEISGTIQNVVSIFDSYGWTAISGTLRFDYLGNEDWNIWINDHDISSQMNITTEAIHNQFGFVLSNYQQGDEVICTYSVGNIHDLSINIDTFIETEQPSGNETVEFIATTSWILAQTYFNSWGENMTVDSPLFMSALQNAFPGLNLSSVTSIAIGITAQSDYPGYQRISVNVEVDHVPDSFSTWVDDKTIWGINCDVWPAFDTYQWESTTIVFDTTWSKNGTTVDIALYGISYTGMPIDGDTLTVTYTHPSIIGYQWNQKDVQPSSGKPSGGESIDWATIIDVHEGEDQGWSTFPIYTIEGGLPDGEYEFYWQTKCSTESYGNRPLGMATYKAIININNDSRNCRGVGSYIIDGQWIGDGNFKTDNNNIWSLFKKSGNDIIIYSSGIPFATDVFGYNPNYGEILECFKLSSIKNTKTGEKYIATGKLFDGNWPNIDYTYDNYILIASLQNEPYIPQYHNNSNWYSPKDNQYFRVQPYNSIATSQNTANCSELDISMVSKSGGKWHIIVENSCNSYKATLLEASGDLANAQLGYNQNNNTFIYLNNTDISDQSISVSIGAKGSSEAASGWPDVPNSFTPITIYKIGNLVTKDNFGTILQYTDETTSEYKKGYFYQATGTEVIVPESIVCTQTYGQESIEITCNDYDGLVSTLSNYTGWTESYIKERLQEGGWLSCRPHSQPYVWYWYTCGELPDSIGIGDYFTLNPYPSYSETQFTVIDVPEHTEIQDGYWEQINVQPNNTVTTIPEATVENYGDIVQYNGQTDQNYTNGYFYKNNAIVTPSSATISQTSGSNLSNITINRLQFEDTEQPSGDENTTFVYAKTTNDIQFTSFGSASMTGGSLEDLKAIFADDGVSWISDFEHGTYFYRPDDSAYGFGPLNKAGIWAYCTPEHLQERGFILTGDITNGDYIEYQVIKDHPGDWKHNSNIVNLKDYGISYEGIPENNNELTVIYTAKVVVGGWDRIDVQPAVDPLPDQTGNAGKVLTTNGTTASWVDIASTPASTPTLLGGSTYWIEDPITHKISQTVTVTGVTFSNIVMVGPTPISAEDYTDAGVICVAQGTNTLTFTCKTIPSVDLTINVVCF